MIFETGWRCRTCGAAAMKQFDVDVVGDGTGGFNAEESEELRVASAPVRAERNRMLDLHQEENPDHDVMVSAVCEAAS